MLFRMQSNSDKSARWECQRHEIADTYISTIKGLTQIRDGIKGEISNEHYSAYS